MYKLPHESLIGQCKHNVTQGFLLVSLLWNEKVAFGKSPVLKFVFGVFLYYNPSTVYVFLNLYWEKFDESYKENQIGVWSKSCLWPLIAHQETVTYKPRISWVLFIYI